MNDQQFRKELRGAPLDIDELADMMTNFIIEIFELVEAQS